MKLKEKEDENEALKVQVGTLKNQLTNQQQQIQILMRKINSLEAEKKNNWVKEAPIDTTASHNSAKTEIRAIRVCQPFEDIEPEKSNNNHHKNINDSAKKINMNPENELDDQYRQTIKRPKFPQFNQNYRQRTSD